MLREAPDQFPTRRVLVAATVCLALLAALIFATVSFRSGTPSDPGLVRRLSCTGRGRGPSGRLRTRQECCVRCHRPLIPRPSRAAWQRAVRLGHGRRHQQEHLRRTAGRRWRSERRVDTGAGRRHRRVSAHRRSMAATAQLLHSPANRARQPECADAVGAGSRRGRTRWVRAGTTAYTVTGVRHRAGIWGERAVTSSHDVAFTVFIVCARLIRVHLLRLSRLDEPLD
jgi:hypothetical protein